MISLKVINSPVKSILVNPENCTFVDHGGNVKCVIPCGLTYDIDVSYDQIRAMVTNRRVK